MKISKSFLSVGAAATLSLFVAAGCAKKTATDTNVATKTGTVTTTTDNSPNGAPANVNKGNANDPGAPSGPVIKSTVLAGFLPASISGYEKKNPENTDMSMAGMNYSVAKSDYISGDSKISVTIMDYNHNQGLAAAYSMFLNGFHVENDDEITESSKIGDYPGWISYKKKQNDGTVGVVVNNRIFVIIEASKASSIDDLKAIAQKVDLAGIAKAS
jgi:hypothetical protein